MTPQEQVLTSLVPITTLAIEDRLLYDCVSVEAMFEFIRYLYPQLKNNPKTPSILSAVAEYSRHSSLSLQRVIEDCNSVYRWLQDQESSALIEDVLAYIACAHQGMSLCTDTTLQWYLRTYGFERSFFISSPSLTPKPRGAQSCSANRQRL